MSRRPPLRFIAIVLSLTSASACARRNPAAEKARFFEKGNAYFADRKYAEATIEYRRALQFDARFGDARLKLAQSLLESGDLANGIREYLRAADTLPDRQDVQIRAGNLLLVQGHFDDAKGKAQYVLKRNPKNVDAQVLLANATAGLRDFESATTDLEDAIKLDPEKAGTYTNLGDVQMAQGRAADAEAAFKKAVALAPQSALARLSLASYYWAAGRIDDAASQLQAAHSANRDNVAVNRALALFAIQQGKPADAEPYLKKIATIAHDAGSKMMLADYYVLLHKNEQAMAVLAPLVATPATRSLATVKLAEIALGERRVAEATKDVDDVLASDPKNPDALLLKARLQLDAGKATDALSSARAAVAAAPRSAAAHYLVASIQYGRGDLVDASREYAEVVKLNPRAVSADLQLAAIEVQRGDTKQAVQFAEEAVRVQPQNATAALLLARTLMARGDISKADATLKPIVAAYPTVAGVQATAGALAMLQHHETDARRELARALELDPRNMEALSSLVTLNLATGRREEVRGLLDARLTQAPDDSLLLLLAARAEAAIGDMVKAESHLQRAIAVDSGNLQAYGMLAQLYTKEKKIGPARDQLATVIKQQPKSVPAHTLMGMLYELDRMPLDARREYEAALAIDSGTPVAANNLAALLLESGKDVDTALQLAQSAKTRLPDDPHVNDTLGWAYARKEMYEPAAFALEASVRANPNNPVVLWHLGTVYFSMGETEKASTALEKALKLDPKFSGAGSAREMLSILH